MTLPKIISYMVTDRQQTFVLSGSANARVITRPGMYEWHFFDKRVLWNSDDKRVASDPITSESSLVSQTLGDTDMAVS